MAGNETKARNSPVFLNNAAFPIATKFPRDLQERVTQAPSLNTVHITTQHHIMSTPNTPDPETQRAIDLSLSKSSPSSPKLPSTRPSPSKPTTDTYKRTRESSIIVLGDTDDEDDDAPPTKRKRVDIIQEKNARAQTRRDESEPKGTLPMDRKAMEEERLKRVQSAARAAAAEKRIEKSVMPSEPASFYSTGDRAGAANRAVKTPGRAPGLEKIQLKEEQEPERMKLKFPDGVVKKTWEGGNGVKADEITIEDVLEKVCRLRRLRNTADANSKHYKPRCCRRSSST